MSLDKAIKSGKEWRKKRRKGCSGYCEWCISNRQYANVKRLDITNQQIKDLNIL